MPSRTLRPSIFESTQPPFNQPVLPSSHPTSPSWPSLYPSCIPLRAGSHARTKITSNADTRRQTCFSLCPAFSPECMVNTRTLCNCDRLLIVAVLGHETFTKQSHFDHEAHSILVRPGSDPGITVVQSVVCFKESLGCGEVDNQQTQQVRSPPSHAPEGGRAQQHEPVRRIAPEIATCHETITFWVSIPSRKNRWAPWRVEQRADER